MPSIFIAAQNNAAVCGELQPKFDALLAWYKASRGTKPAIPVPLVIEPDCVQCKDGSHDDPNQPLIDNFVQKNAQPEADMIKGVLEIARQKILHNAGGNVLPGDHYPDNGTTCFDKMGDDDLKKILDLAESRLQYKAGYMVSTYKTSPEYFLGGLPFYLSVLRQLQLLGYTQNDGMDNPELMTWVKAYYQKYQQRLLSQYQYNLYPGVFYLPRQVMLMGMDLPETKELAKDDNGDYVIKVHDEALELINKAITFMHFKLKIKLDATGHSETGGALRAVINGECELFCSLTTTNDGESCYEWKGDNNNSIKFKVDQLIFSNHEGIMNYKGPNEFLNGFDLNLALCDKGPQFILTMQDVGPPSELFNVPSQDGKMNELVLNNVISSLFGSIMADATLDRLKKMQSQESELEALAQRGEAHKNDPNYANTPQGKKDKAMMLQLQKQFGTDNDGADQNTSMMSQVTKIVTPFKTGNAKPVDFTANAKQLTQHGGGSGWDNATLTVTVEEFPDPKDNIKQ